MPVTYTRINWKNHVVTRPRTYDETANQDGSITHAPAPGTIVQHGTPINEANLNVMDKGVFDCANAINALEEAKVGETVFNATIPTTGWVGSSAPYSCQVNVSGLRVTDAPFIDPRLTGDYQADAAILDAFGLIYRIVAINGALAIDADAVPETAIPIRVRCLRNG